MVTWALFSMCAGEGGLAVSLCGQPFLGVCNGSREVFQKGHGVGTEDEAKRLVYTGGWGLEPQRVGSEMQLGVLRAR